MNKRQIILGLKRPSEFTLSERQQIVEEYLLQIPVILTTQFQFKVTT